MRIESDIKLDYKDVLIRPKRSTLGSRKEVDLNRAYTFRNFDPMFEHENWETYHYQGVPVMAANMDGVGTFEMADALAKEGMFTCLVKTYSVNELVCYFDTDDYLRTNHVAMSIGITQADHDKFRAVYEQADGNLKYVCIDVANGYSQRFVEFVKEFRQLYPHIVIIAGNVSLERILLRWELVLVVCVQLVFRPVWATHNYPRLSSAQMLPTDLAAILLLTVVALVLGRWLKHLLQALIS